MAIVVSAQYLTEHPLYPAVVGGTGFAFVAGAVAWLLPRWTRRRFVVRAVLALGLVLMVLPPASARWPGGITSATFGLTVVGIMPLPVVDITIDADGSLWFRDKTHRVTLVEARALAEGADRLIIGTGWNQAVRVEGGVETVPGIEVEVLTTKEAISRYGLLREKGVRVAILLHSTC